MCSQRKDHPYTKSPSPPPALRLPGEGVIALLIFSLFASGAFAQTSNPTTAPIDPALWQTLQQIDAQAANITSLRGDFRQEKFTAFMKKSLVSTGKIVASGALAVWSTTFPEQTRMLVNDHEIQIYYPHQLAEEIYPIGGKLGALASSPLPRLDTLRKFFTISPIGAGKPTSQPDEAGWLALKLEPIDEQLREHVKVVRVSLDRKSGLVQLVETVDPDGERTALTFSNIQINPELKADELKLTIPSGTRIDHPLGTGDASTPTKDAAH